MYIQIFLNIFFPNKGYRRSIRHKINTGGTFLNIKTRVSNSLALLMVIYMYICIDILYLVVHYTTY